MELQYTRAAYPDSPQPPVCMVYMGSRAFGRTISLANVTISAHWYSRIKLQLGKVMVDPRKAFRVDLNDFLKQNRVLRTQPMASIKSKKRSTPVNKTLDFDNDPSPTQPIISTEGKKLIYSSRTATRL
jgi:hypothetical protein